MKTKSNRRGRRQRGYRGLLWVLAAGLLLFGLIAQQNILLGTSSRHALLMDARTGQVLARKRSGEEAAPASLTKMMTVLLATEALPDPVKENRSNCPFLTENHCAIHDAEPLVCALYPLAQEISREGQVSYFLQPTGCGGQVIEARVQDYLSRYDVPAREALDVRWALTCMELEDEVERLEAVLSPVLLRRAQAKLWQALYYHYDYAQPWLPQLEANLHGLKADWAKLTAYQQKQNMQSK